MNEHPPSRFVAIDALDAFPAGLRGGVVAIGNFDGVHRGHRRVLETALSHAQDAGVPAYALTFEPHPRSVFQPDTPVFRLTPPAQKARILAAMGLDGIVSVPFTRAFAGIEAEAFVTDILQARLGIVHAVTGYDFHFGRARRGTPEFLSQAGVVDGFGVTIVAAETDESATAVSSSRIRAALAEGDIALANALLGYRWSVEAEVRHGEKRGRDLGYPTANLALAPETQLAHGIYAVRVLLDGRWIDGVASFGRRPTFDNGAPLLEVFLFDFSGDLYGKTLRVTLASYLRPELRFDSADALVSQMDRDSAEARAALASLTPLGSLDSTLNGLPGEAASG
ncbi:bifunctional riboflavin kinase/FAD synthetase [Stappia sp. ES.058]|uniref:bifunctional riboflavin kinase/FAD synthetase n=1 Tax=Stappia sp. ES.058 TaxID=1881061 RepID=UPI00087AE4F8|nr:bifunctional riboflavin kinase/FAD synthetase [Stappia sp. ES.058]SDT91477.1 riboflavin kinase / FMN adenylyltransferase [Stappia sp. ES.058]